MINNGSQKRLVFLDNLRYSIVLLVVVLHVGLGYLNAASWWYVVDPNSSGFFDILVFTLDSFMMPALFFIAGYFVLPSLQRRTNRAFLEAKLTRLGIPWLLGVFFLVPVMPYFYHFTRATTPLSFWEFWQGFVKSVGDFQMILGDSSDFINDANLMNHFSHHHLWFISLLLFFFIGFTLLYQVKSQFSAATIPRDGEKTSTQSIWIALLATGFVISLSVIVVNYFISAIAWANIYNVLMFQPVRFPLYLGLFGLGIYAYSKNWLTQHDLPGYLVVWLIVSVLLLLALLGVISNLIEFIKSGVAIPFWLIAIHGFVRTFLVLTVLVFLLSLTQRYWNRSSKIGQNLAASSYDIYILHLPIVVILQYLFISVDIAIFFKFVVIFLLSTLLSYGISHYLIIPFLKKCHFKV